MRNIYMERITEIGACSGVKVLTGAVVYGEDVMEISG